MEDATESTARGYPRMPGSAPGRGLWACAGFAILTSLPQPLTAVPAFLLVSLFHPLLPAGLAFAGGAMTFLVVSELVPDSLARCSHEEAAWSVVVGLVAMLGVTAGLGL